MTKSDEIEKKINEFQSVISSYNRLKERHKQEYSYLEELTNTYEAFQSSKIMTNHGYEDMPKEAEYNFEISLNLLRAEDSYGKRYNITPRIGDKDAEEIYNLFDKIWIKRIESQRRIVESLKDKLEKEAEKIALRIS